jgi:hypothetical protein
MTIIPVEDLRRQPTHDELLEAVEELLAEVRYLAPEKFDDAEHEDNFHANLARYDDMLMRAAPLDPAALAGKLFRKDTFADPDVVGSSEYRAVMDVLDDAYTLEDAVGILDEFRRQAEEIKNQLLKQIKNENAN